MMQHILIAKNLLRELFQKDGAYEIAKNPKYNGYQRGLEYMVYKFFDKKTRSELKVSVNEEQAQELHKPVIKTRDLKIICGKKYFN